MRQYVGFIYFFKFPKYFFPCPESKLGDLYHRIFLEPLPRKDGGYDLIMKETETGKEVDFCLGRSGALEEETLA